MKDLVLSLLWLRLLLWLGFDPSPSQGCGQKKKKKKQKKKPNKPVVCLPLTFVFSTIGQTEVLEKSCGSEQTYVRSLVIIYPP